MKPSKKSEGMERALHDMFGFDRRDAIEQHYCIPPPMGCGQLVEGFRDSLSEKEYTISGLCQKCQDSVSGG